MCLCTQQFPLRAVYPLTPLTSSLHSLTPPYTQSTPYTPLHPLTPPYTQWYTRRQFLQFHMGRARSDPAKRAAKEAGLKHWREARPAPPPCREPCPCPAGATHPVPPSPSPHRLPTDTAAANNAQAVSSTKYFVKGQDAVPVEGSL